MFVNGCNKPLQRKSCTIAPLEIAAIDPLVYCIPCEHKDGKKVYKFISTYIELREVLFILTIPHISRGIPYEKNVVKVADLDYSQKIIYPGMSVSKKYVIYRFCDVKIFTSVKSDLVIVTNIDNNHVFRFRDEKKEGKFKVLAHEIMFRATIVHGVLTVEKPIGYIIESKILEHGIVHIKITGKEDTVIELNRIIEQFRAARPS